MSKRIVLAVFILMLCSGLLMQPTDGQAATSAIRSSYRSASAHAKLPLKSSSANRSLNDCASAWTTIANKTFGYGQEGVNDLIYRGPSAAWAVGVYSLGSPNNSPLVLHWDGDVWHQDTSITSTGRLNALADIDGTLWTIGKTDAGLPLILEQTSPNSWLQHTLPITYNTMTVRDIAGTASNDIWLVGDEDGGAAFVLHWNGLAWSEVSLPAAGGDLFHLNTVQAANSTEVWIGGSYLNASRSFSFPAIFHLSGGTWTVTATNDGAINGEITDIAVNGSERWAVGTPQGQTPIVLRWNSTEWEYDLSTPAYSGGLASYTRVKVFGPDQVWIAGYTPFQSVANRWDGTNWIATEPATFVNAMDGLSANDMLIGGNGTILQRHAAVVEFTAAEVTAEEEHGSVTLTLQLNNPALITTTVSISTSDGSAFAGVDYIATATQLSIAPCTAAQTVAIPLIDDQAHTGTRSFTVQISATAGLQLGTRASATVTIVDPFDLPSTQLVFLPTVGSANGNGQSAPLAYANVAGGSPQATIFVFDPLQQVSTPINTYTSQSGVSTILGDWSPNSQQIVFSRLTPSTQIPGSLYQLFRINRDGSGLQQLTDSQLTSYNHARWMPNTNQIIADARTVDPATFQTTNYSLVIHTLNTAALQTIYTFEADVKDVADMDISPDGTKVVLSLVKQNQIYSDLYIFDLSSQQLTPLTLTPAVEEKQPTWSPDGQTIAYNAGQIYLIDSNGQNTRLLNQNFNTSGALAWSPDAQAIATANGSSINLHTVGSNKQPINWDVQQPNILSLIWASR